MNKKDFKKQFINEFKKENDLKLTFKDTFNNEEINQKNYQHEYLSLKRRFKLTALCSCILICFLVVGLCITLKLYKDNINNTDDYGFTQKELKFVNENSDLFNEIPKAILNIIDNQSIVIYKGFLRNSNIHSEIYFYKIINYINEFSININNQIISINEQNLFGILCIQNKNVSVDFELIYDKTIKKYKIS